MTLKRSDQIVLICLTALTVAIALGMRATLAPELQITRFITKFNEPLDLNTATLEELIDLPGIGPVLAQRIIEYRGARGGFKSVEELLEIRGIGPKRFDQLKDRVRVKVPQDLTAP